jgi:DNA polymerase-3 subunit delta
LKLQLTALQDDLARRLLPVYVISGDDPLQTGEAADAVRARARAAGYTEREVFFVERGGSNWADVRQAAEALSLFASRRVVEVRMPSGKPDKGEDDLLKVIAAAGDDLLLLILTDKLERKSESASWMSAAQQRGAWLPVYPVRLGEFPAWLQRRARAAGLELDSGALQLLVARTEGNLLAAKQELDKLALQFGSGARIDAAAMAASSSNSARFDLFQFAEVVANGDAARAFRVLDGLRSEGTELPLILWALVRAKAMLQDQSRPLPFARITARAVRADKMAKGRLAGEAWDEVALLTAELCGRRVLPLEHWQTV